MLENYVSHFLIKRHAANIHGIQNSICGFIGRYMKIAFYPKITHNKHFYVVREFLEFIVGIVKPMYTFVLTKKLVTDNMPSLKKTSAPKPQMRREYM